MQKLKADIKNRQFKNCYLFYGEEDYLKRLYRDSLKAAVLNGGDDMNCTRFQGKETDVVQIKDLADTLPFFSDLPIVHRLHFNRISAFVDILIQAVTFINLTLHKK